MKIELQEKLFKKYPKIFQGKDKSIKEFLMPFGIECGSGWYWLIDQLCNSIQKHLNAFRYPSKRILQVEAIQIKEKFGSLRYYFNGGDANIEGMVELAEQMSYSICETCGSTENVTQTKGRWIITLCQECLKKAEKRGTYNE